MSDATCPLGRDVADVVDHALSGHSVDIVGNNKARDPQADDEGQKHADAELVSLATGRTGRGRSRGRAGLENSNFAVVSAGSVDEPRAADCNALRATIHSGRGRGRGRARGNVGDDVGGLVAMNGGVAVIDKGVAEPSSVEDAQGTHVSNFVVSPTVSDVRRCRGRGFARCSTGVSHAAHGGRGRRGGGACNGGANGVVASNGSGQAAYLLLSAAAGGVQQCPERNESTPSLPNPATPGVEPSGAAPVATECLCRWPKEWRGGARGLEEWLRSLCPAGFLMCYRDVLVTSHGSLEQLVVAYARPGPNGRSTLDTSLFADMGVRKKGHRRLIEKWFREHVQ